MWWWIKQGLNVSNRLNKEKLSLDHQKLLNERLERLDVKLSEYTFANLYLFRDLHQYEVIIDKEVFIRGMTRDKVPFLMPLFKPTRELLPLILSHLEQQEILFPLPQGWISLFDKSFEISYDEADSDYLFHIDKLALYPGRHLSKKRNLVKQLINEHQVKTIDLTPQNKEGAIHVLNAWKDEVTESAHGSDYAACLEALNLLNELNLQGQLYLVDDQPSAFILGEWMNADCFVVHFEKAMKSKKGLYQYLLQHFAQSLQKKDAWINLEQDLGSIPIRQSKHSYQPDELAHKMRVKYQV